MAPHLIILLICSASIGFLLLIASDPKVWFISIEPGIGSQLDFYYSNIMILLYILLLVLLLFMVDLYLKEGKVKKRLQVEGLNLIQKVVDKRERIIIQELINSEGMTQAELQQRTNMSKATLSRILAKLEEKELIVRYRAGMAKKVKLKESDFLME